METLPPEVFGHIVGSLGVEQEIAKIPLVCKRWNALIHDPMAGALPARYSGDYRTSNELKRRPTHLWLLEGSTLRLKSLDLSWLMELHIDNASRVKLEPLNGAAPMLDKLTLRSRGQIFYGGDSYEKFIGGHRVSELEMQGHPIDPRLLVTRLYRSPPLVTPVESIPPDAIEWNSEFGVKAKNPRNHFVARIVAKIIISDPSGVETINHIRGGGVLQTKVVVGQPGDTVFVELDPLNGFAGIIGHYEIYYQSTAPIRVWSVEDTARGADNESWGKIDVDFEYFTDQVMTGKVKEGGPCRLYFGLLVTNLEIYGPNLGAAAVHVDYMTNTMPGDPIMNSHMLVYRGRAVDADGVVRIPLNSNLSRSDCCKIWTDQPSDSRVTVVGKTKNIFRFRHGCSGSVFAP